MKMTTLETLARLEREMAAANRTEEQQALLDALAALGRPERGYVTIEQAAELLGISIPMAEDWIRRGTLIGAELGERWMVARESVERILSLREILAEMDREGNPTIEDILRLRKKTRRAEDESQVA